jgi:carbamoyl-phosphate synthase large subunit
MSRNKEARLLFIGGGRRVKLLKSFQNVLSQTNRGTIITTDTEPMAASSFVADKTFLVPYCSDVDAFTSRITEICSSEQISVIIPLLCAAVATVPILRQKIEAKFISGTDSAIEICMDKKLTYEFLKQSSLPTPEMFEDPQPEHLPLFFRKRFSEGSKDSAMITDVAVLEAKKDLPDGIFTKYLNGREFTVDAYKDLQGKLVCMVSRERLKIRAGEVEKSVTSFQPKLLSLIRQALESLDFVGPITAQAIEFNDEFFITEFNLRYGGGVTLSTAAGMNSPQWLIRELLDDFSPLPPPIKWGLGMARYDEEFYYNAGKPTEI